MSPSLEQQRQEVLAMAARLTEARSLYTEGLRLLEANDYQSAGELISRAAEMGDSTAQCQLGDLCQNGFFGEPNPEEAVRWYRQAADQCLPHGQFRLGASYQLGRGVGQDYEAAARLFELAARRGHAEAAQSLQMLREMAMPGPETAPEPVPQPSPIPELPPELDDPAVTDAVAAYQEQAMRNVPSAQLKLGLAYHIGRSAPANPKIACFWVMRAMLTGDYTAAQYLHYCTRAVPLEEQGALQSKIFMWMPGEPVPQL